MAPIYSKSAKGYLLLSVYTHIIDDAESKKVGPGIVISNLGTKKCQKHAKNHILSPKMGEFFFTKSFYCSSHRIDLKLCIVTEFYISLIYRLGSIIVTNF